MWHYGRHKRDLSCANESRCIITLHDLPCYNVAGLFAATYRAREKERRNLLIDRVQEGVIKDAIEACSLH